MEPLAAPLQANLHVPLFSTLNLTKPVAAPHGNNAPHRETIEDDQETTLGSLPNVPSENSISSDEDITFGVPIGKPPNAPTMKSITAKMRRQWLQIPSFEELQKHREVLAASRKLFI